MTRSAMALGVLILAATLVGCSSDDETSGNGGSGGSTGGGGSGGIGGDGGVGPTGPIEGTVQRYDYAFDFTTWNALSELGVEVTEGGDCYSIASQTWPQNVTLQGEAATSFTPGDGQLAACGPSVSAGETLTLTADAVLMEQTHFNMDIGASRKPNLVGGTFSYLLSWVGGCDLHGPCDDHPGRLAEFHFDLTHDAGTTALCPGAITAGDTTTQCELSGTLAPTYSAFFAAHDPDWVRTPFVTAAGIDVVFYEVPGGGLAAALDSQDVADYLAWITTLLGPYPYGTELRIAGAPTHWLGFEHPGNIILRDTLPSLQTSHPNQTLSTFIHEVAHMWAGNRTTLAESADFVWKEATAEYLLYVYEDEHLPPSYAEATKHYWHFYATWADYHPRPTDDPTPPVHEFYGDTYAAGPMVLYLQLESMLGRQTVLDAIQGFLANNDVRGVADLQAELEAASGQELQAYFDAWVFGSGEPTWPTMLVTTDQQGDQVTVTVTQQGSELFGCLVEVDVHGANTTVTAEVDFGLAPTSAAAQATVTLAEPVVSADIDPRERLIEQSATATAKAAGPAPPLQLR